MKTWPKVTGRPEQVPKTPNAQLPLISDNSFTLGTHTKLLTHLNDGFTHSYINDLSYDQKWRKYRSVLDYIVCYWINCRELRNEQCYKFYQGKGKGLLELCEENKEIHQQVKYADENFSMTFKLAQLIDLFTKDKRFGPDKSFYIAWRILHEADAFLFNEYGNEAHNHTFSKHQREFETMVTNTFCLIKTTIPSKIFTIGNIMDMYVRMRSPNIAFLHNLLNNKRRD